MADDLWSYENFQTASAEFEASNHFSSALRLMEFALGVQMRLHSHTTVAEPFRRKYTAALTSRELAKKPQTKLRPYSALSRQVAIGKAIGEVGRENEEPWRCMRHIACLCNSLALLR